MQLDNLQRVQLFFVYVCKSIQNHICGSENKVGDFYKFGNKCTGIFDKMWYSCNQMTLDLFFDWLE